MIEHTKLVTRMAKPGSEILVSMTAERVHLLHMAVGVSGEAGELLDAVKKHVIYGKPLDRKNLIEELGDIEFYLEGIRQSIGIDRQAILNANITKLTRRYGDKYTDSAAIGRADKND